MTAKDVSKKIKMFFKEHGYEIIIGVSVFASTTMCYRIYEMGCAKGYKEGFESCNRVVMFADPEGYPNLEEKANAIIRNNNLFKTN